jgi:hypothetical protein
MYTYATLVKRYYWFLNKLPGFVQGAIRRLDLQREESSESSVWDVDTKSTEFPGSGNIAQMLIYFKDFDAIINENYDINNYSRIL